MYEYIKGDIAELNPANVVIEAAGIGYIINISLQTYSELEKKTGALVYIHYIVREDAQILYGFAGRQERDIFRLLISVSGVGGNTARMILSTYTPQELVNIISSENAGLLKNVKGLGLKTSQKIIVELKDKITGIAYSGGPSSGNTVLETGGIYEEAVAALTMLGFSKSSSDKVLRAVIKENPMATVEEIIRMSLKKL